MGVSNPEYRQALGVFLDGLCPVQNEDDGSISVISATIEGAYGADCDYGARVVYQVLVDVSHLRDERLPTVWIARPDDDAIGHVNIFHSGACPLTGTPLPYLCWGNTHAEWQKAPPDHRTLLALLEYVAQHLNQPNYSSRAR